MQDMVLEILDNADGPGRISSKRIQPRKQGLYQMFSVFGSINNRQPFTGIKFILP